MLESNLDLSVELFSRIADTYKDISTTNPSEVSIQYNGKKYEQVYRGTREEIYPVETKPTFDNGVSCTDKQFYFITKLIKYCPKDTKIEDSYISPSTQAKIGLEKLLEINPALDLSKFIGNKTNPELIGKFKDYFLFEFDYNLVKVELAKNNINWANINKSYHQKGLEFDLTSKDNFGLLCQLLSFLFNNSVFNEIQKYEIKNNTLHILLKEEYVFESINISKMFITNSGNNNNISDCINLTSQKNIYQILKKHGYGDLKDNPSLSQAQLARMPKIVKNRGTALSKAINEALYEVLGGKNGVISNYQQNTHEYLFAVARGLTAALTALSVELNTLTEGKASQIVKDTFESEVYKTPNKESIKNNLIIGEDLSKNAMKSFISDSLKDSDITEKIKFIDSSKNNHFDLIDATKSEADDHFDIYKKYSFAEKNLNLKRSAYFSTEIKIASKKWVIEHNLNVKDVDFNIVDSNGNKVNAVKNNLESTENKLVIDFSYAVIGKIIITAL